MFSLVLANECQVHNVGGVCFFPSVRYVSFSRSFCLRKVGHLLLVLSMDFKKWLVKVVGKEEQVEQQSSCICISEILQSIKYRYQKGERIIVNIQWRNLNNFTYE